MEASRQAVRDVMMALNGRSAQLWLLQVDNGELRVSAVRLSSDSASLVFLSFVKLGDTGICNAG